MSADETPLISSQNGMNSQLLFQNEPLRFDSGAPNRQAGDPSPKLTRELTGFTDDKLFTAGVSSDRYFSTEHHSSGFPRNLYGDDHHRRDTNWNGNGNGTSSDESEGEEEDDDDEDDDVEDDDDLDNGDGENRNKSSNNVATTSKNGGNLDKLGARGEPMVAKDGSGGPVQTGQNDVTIAEADSEMYYSPYLQLQNSGNGGKDPPAENGCGFVARKEVFSYSSESGESLRAILSDPVTGTLMDDAMILPCGHSFGGGGIRQVIRMKCCYTCSRPISEDSVAPNLSLRVAVQAFRREEEDLQNYRSSKRRRERFDQEKGNCGDPNSMDPPRGRGVKFPFIVTDRVIIKGNKRTPLRFVGREAVVTTQCLNGWYVVKTLDNAESVKLQYRSLAKISDGSSF